MFIITSQKGFQITFENGCTASVQFGGGNYCSNHALPVPFDEDDVICDDAEICAWNKNGDIITPLWGGEKGDGYVIGWVSPDKVADFISWVKNCSPDIKRQVG